MGLLAAHADCSAVDRMGLNAFQVASTGGHVAVLLELLEAHGRRVQHGADPEALLHGYAERRDVLSLAVFRGHGAIDCVRLLFEHKLALPLALDGELLRRLCDLADAR